MNSAESLDLLKIKSQIRAELLVNMAAPVIFDTIDSTNNWALDQCRDTVILPKICFAERQLAGRGRKNRDWYSPRAQNIYMSIAYKFDIKPDQLYGLSMVMGVCIVRVLGKLGVKAGLKWPNDVYVGVGKIAGILIETRVKQDAGMCAVIGVGLNYDMAKTSSVLIENQWTDLLKEIKDDRTVDRSVLAGMLLNEILTVCDQFASIGFDGFRNEWQEYDLCIGRRLDIFEGGRVIEGEYIGINEHGALMVIVDGRQETFYAADVSIRMK